MGKFSNLLKHFARISKLEELWRHRGELAALRGLYLGLAANTSVIIGVFTQVLSGSYIYAFLAATGSLWLLFPLAILIASKNWKGRMKNVVFRDDDFNWRMFLEDEYEEQLRRINDLGLEKSEADKLKVEGYREHQEIIRLFQAKIATRPRLPVEMDSLQDILQDIKTDLSNTKSPKSDEMLSKVKELEHKAKYYLSP